VVPPEESNETLREVFNSIKKLFQKESERHAKEMQSLVSELATAKAAIERAERDIAAVGDANAKNSKHFSELEDQIRNLHEAKDKTDTAMSIANTTLSSVQSELETERREKRSARQESHEAVARETQRERDRLLTQMGQRIGNIIDSYREIRSRGPLPEGVPAMVGNMMDELLSRLEAVGVRLKRD